VVTIIIIIITSWVAVIRVRLFVSQMEKRKGYLFYEWSENGRISNQLYASDRCL